MKYNTHIVPCDEWHDRIAGYSRDDSAGTASLKGYGLFHSNDEKEALRKKEETK